MQVFRSVRKPASEFQVPCDCGDMSPAPVVCPRADLVSCVWLRRQRERRRSAVEAVICDTIACNRNVEANLCVVGKIPPGLPQLGIDEGVAGLLLCDTVRGQESASKWVV